MKITTTVSTRGRYFTTLPACLIAIANQTRPPDEFILFDDNDETKDLREISIYKHIFNLFSTKGIEWKVIYGKRAGQVLNHQTALELAKGEFIYRLDDDNLPQPNVLEILYKTISSDSKLGAVAGLVPPSNYNTNSLASNKIEDIFLGMNIQWFKNTGIKEVDHLYSSFIFRKEAAKHGYCLELSRIGHREETIFTYTMKVNGWKLFINSDAITWHFQEEGGIRSFNNIQMWKHDDNIFNNKLNEWGIIPNKYKFHVLDSGLGDHFSFKSILPEIKDKFKNTKLIIACCYPNVFYDTKDVILISICDAINALGDISEYNVYRKAIDYQWKDTLANLYRKIYIS